MNVNDRRACGYSTRKRGSVYVLLHYGLEVGTGRDSSEINALIDALAARLSEAERNEGTLLGMIHHQRDVLRECLPYLNESMAGKRPGRSADDIRAAVKALTSASADGPKGEK